MTVARSAGFDSRADVGLAPPRSISRAIDPVGTALHHGGLDVPTDDHHDCRAYWLAWQRMHMAPGGLGTSSGAADVAYTVAVCQHGILLAGRGAGVRTGANGTNAGNTSYYAVVWVGGSRQTPTVAALEGIAYAVLELRRLGAGDRVVGHSDLKATGCPHPRILELARTLDQAEIAEPGDEPDPDPPPPPTPPAEEPPMPTTVRRGARGLTVKLAQGALVAHGHAPANTIRPDGSLDGIFGPGTEGAVKAFQRAKGLGVDGIVGPNTWRALWDV